VGELRIIAGSLKGRRLRVPQRAELRPTPERVREALFDILGSDVSGTELLDAYSGTGALGLEALSRGARHATFIEQDREACRRLCEAARRFGIERSCSVHCARVLTRLVPPGRIGPFDLILADPPYRSREAVGLLEAVGPAGCLRPGGLLVLERDRRSEPAAGPGSLTLERSERYGETRLDFYRLPTRS